MQLQVDTTRAVYKNGDGIVLSILSFSLSVVMRAWISVRHQVIMSTYNGIMKAPGRTNWVHPVPVSTGLCSFTFCEQ